MLQEGPPDGPRRRRRIAYWALLSAVVVVLAALAVYGVIGARGYYVLSPGNAPVVTASSSCRPVGGGSFALPDGRPCVQLIVPAADAHPVDGAIMMVDVLEGKPTPLQFLAYEAAGHGLGFLAGLDGSDEFLPNAEILGSGSAAELGCENTEEAVQATSAAPVAALRALGYSVGVSDLGAQIDQVAVGTPAAAAGLRCDDLVTAVDGVKVTTDVAFGEAIRAHRPGQTVTLTVVRAEPGGSTKTLTLTAKLSGTPAIDGEAANPRQAFLGVVDETRTTFHLPIDITAQVGSIGGPSDGLALALGFIDTLGQGHLTGGLDVAVTGEIDAQGDVLPIGGAAQKAVAVRRAGATVFIVPSANYAAAKSRAGSMKVLPVTTLRQALADLEALGGTAPAPPATT